MTRPDRSAAGPERTVAFQGESGAYSELASRSAFPGWATLPCPAFEDAFAAVRDGRAARAMIPIENSSAGRVADIHHLLPESGLFIVGEHFQKVDHQLLAVPGARLDGIRRARSHVQALSQCRNFLRSLGIEPVIHADTAGAAAEVARLGDPEEAAVASALAAETYGLVALARDIHDAEHNTTRFVVMAREARTPAPGDGPVVTTFVFRVRSVPAALYKALGGFATNGVNITKLESYIVDGSFTVAQFFADIDGHPEDHLVALALEELEFFTTHVTMLGTYPAAPFRGRESPGTGVPVPARPRQEPPIKRS